MVIIDNIKAVINFLMCSLGYHDWYPPVVAAGRPGVRVYCFTCKKCNTSQLHTWKAIGNDT